MEILKEGRVTIKENGEDLEIHIKAPRNWFLFFFAGIQFLGFSIGLSFLIYDMLANFSFGLIILLIPLSLIWLFIFRIVLWGGLGKEVLKFTNETLTIKKKNALFVPTKTYDLGLIKDFWVENEKMSPLFLLYFKRKYINIGSFGAIRFQYDDDIIKCGASLNEVQANYIVTFLKEKGVLSK